MGTNLSYVLVTPYTIAKSRTGGVLSRLISRTNLELVGAQMFAPDEKFAKDYAKTLRMRSPQNQIMLLADYVEKNLPPSGGRPHRTLLLLFRGENACEQLTTACGHLYSHNVEVDALSGETIRDTYADLVFSIENPEMASYFEPAVLTPRNQKEANEDLLFMMNHLEERGNIVQNMVYPDPSKIERTLAIIKPDNWTYNSSKPGAIIDMFSRTGLRIVGIKVFRFSLSQALEFYSPVETILKENLAPELGKKAKALLEKEYSISLSEKSEKALTETIGIDFAVNQFEQILKFMCGRKRNEYPPEKYNESGDVRCMILVYEGENAVKKIRDVLGPTDPLSAPDGTIRKEFGSDIMKNTAHASDSVESFNREKDIVKIDENILCSIIRETLLNGQT